MDTQEDQAGTVVEEEEEVIEVDIKKNKNKYNFGLFLGRITFFFHFSCYVINLFNVSII